MAAIARALVGERINGFGALGNMGARFAGILALWIERADARRELSALTAREIADIGFDADEIEREVAKPFWRA